MKKGLLCLVAGLAIVMVPAPLALAQGHGGGGGGGHGGGGGCGDVFGDLIHLLRDEVTGQPILAQRWIEMPKELPGYGWGYCPIAVDEFGNELGFAPLSCDVAVADLERVVIKTVDGTPVFLSDLATIRVGGAIRRGLQTRNGTEEIVAGQVIKLFGSNSSTVIGAVEEKLAEVNPGFEAAQHRPHASMKSAA